MEETRCNLNELEKDEIIRRYNGKANLLYRFVMLYGDYTAEAKDYGTGELATMVEVHTLGAIEERPGVNASELALMWNRTKGAISQTLTKLEKKGYITRAKQEGNAKTVMLHPTEKGARLSQAHKLYDSVEIANTIEELKRKGCSERDIETFFRVVSKYAEILE